MLRTPEIEEMLMIEPLPTASIDSTTACMPSITLRVFTRKWRSSSSGVVSSNGLGL
ncbi:hypothetical protein D9M70_460480 [compost metagenome]